MSQFDVTGPQKAAVACAIPEDEEARLAWQFKSDSGYYLLGREDLKPSMVIMAKALFRVADFKPANNPGCGSSELAIDGYKSSILSEAIAEVKARGDWPLEEK